MRHAHVIVIAAAAAANAQLRPLHKAQQAEAKAAQQSIRRMQAHKH
jgi:hypothetical protein